MNKKKIVLSCILSLIMCVSLIVGGTYALFTSESNVNIAVQSGKVQVTANVELVSTSSMGVDQTVGEFANAGSSASVKGANVELNNIMPGDKAVLKITIVNDSTVAIKQRIALRPDSQTGLFKSLFVGVSDDNATYTYYTSATFAWEGLSAGSEPVVKYLSIELPEFAGNEAQDDLCNISVVVEAVQGNATTADDASVTYAHVVDTVPADGKLDLSKVNDGETVIIGGNASIWANASITVDSADAREIYIRGYAVDTMNVVAPLGTIHVYNDVKNLSGDVAPDSLHVYGKVATLTLTQGRAVVEDSANVANVVINATAGETAKVEIINHVARVEVVAESAGTAIVLGSVGETVVPDDVIFVQGNLPSEGGANVYTVTNELQFKEALKLVTDGDTITLGDDINLTKDYYLSKDLTLDLNGFNALLSNDKSFVVRFGHLHVTGAGKIETSSATYPTIQVNGQYQDSANSATLTIDENATIANTTGYAISVFPKSNECYNVVVNIAGKIKAAAGLTVNGGTVLSDNSPVINIKNTAVIEAVQTGIYAAGQAIYNVEEGAYISGLTAIEVRAGVLTINGGTFVGATDAFTIEAKNNGATSFGAALAISQHTTNLPIDVVINGGEFVGYYALYEQDVQDNKARDVISIAVNGGNFDGLVYSQNQLQVAIDLTPAGGTLTLASDIVISDCTGGTSGNSLILYNINKDMTLDLNGKTISIADSVGAGSIVGVPYIFAIYGNVVIKNGTINAEAGSNAVYAIDVLGGALNLEDTTIYGAPSAVQVAKGNLTITSGHYALADTIKGYDNNGSWSRYIINCIDSNYKDGTATVDIIGGTFVNFNPANNAAEGQKTDFVHHVKYMVTEETKDNGDVWYTVKEDPNAVLIYTADELWAFAASVNGKDAEGNIVGYYNDKGVLCGDGHVGKTVYMMNDIDLANNLWIPIGQTGSTQFGGTFDGQGHTLYGLNIDTQAELGEQNQNYSTGLFGWLNAGTVQNLNVSGATVKGVRRTAVIAGYLELGAAVNNCNVLDSTVVCNHVGETNDNHDCGDKAGAIVGYMNGNCSVSNCTATRVSISAGRDAGQIVGAGYTSKVTKCSATEVTVSSCSTVCKGGNIRNEIIGRVLGA